MWAIQLQLIKHCLLALVMGNRKSRNMERLNELGINNKYIPLKLLV